MTGTWTRVLAGLAAVALLAGTAACGDGKRRGKSKSSGKSSAVRADDRDGQQASASPAPTPTRTGGSPLRWAGQSGQSMTVQLGIGDRRYDGLAVVQNVSTAPLTLQSVTVQGGDSPEVRVTQAGVVALRDRVDENIGVVSTLPPGTKLVPVAGARVLPRQSSQTRYAIVFTIEARQPGRWKAPALLVTYRDGTSTHRFELGYALTVCVAAESTSEC